MPCTSTKLDRIKDVGSGFLIRQCVLFHLHCISQIRSSLFLCWVDYTMTTNERRNSLESALL